MFTSKKIFIPILIATFFSLFYIFTTTSKIKNDAYEYDALSNSILQGEYSINGSPSMVREPGYPLFRAILKYSYNHLTFILFVQLLLFLSTIYIVGIITEKIAPETGKWGLFGASLSYSLAFYTSVHLSEIFISFLVALLALVLSANFNKKPQIKDWVYLSIISSAILLTRYPYLFIVVSGIIILAIYSHKNGMQKKAIVVQILLSISIIIAFVSPWIIRNNNKFNEASISGRVGGVLYARAWKADKDWRNFFDSIASATLGRGVLFTIYPNNKSIWLDQWEDWWRNPKIVKEMWGDDPIIMDRNRKKAALKIIFQDFDNISKFSAWTFVDTIRLLQLPNPIPEAQGSPFEGTYGPLAKEGKLSRLQFLSLLLVHIIQLIWIVFIFISTYLGFKKYRFNFIPGILFISVLLAYSIADNIPRYGAPLQPWLLSAIFITIIFPIYEKYKNTQTYNDKKN